MLRLHELKLGYEYIMGRNSRIICSYIDYGEWLNIAFVHFEKRKMCGTICGNFEAWLKENVGISASYARMLRDYLISTPYLVCKFMC